MRDVPARLASAAFDMRRFFLKILLLTVILQPGMVWAHAQLRSSEPASGAVLDAAPAHIILTFSEPVSSLALRLIGPDGSVRDIEGMAENERLTLRPPAGLADGTHLLSWRVVSSDGHPIGGTLTYHLGTPSAAPPAADGPSNAAARASVVLRFLLTLALTIAVGAAIFAATVQRGAVGAGVVRLAHAAALAAVPVGLGLLAAHGLDLLALPPSALRTVAPWQAALSAPLAVTVALSLVAVILAMLALRTEGDRHRMLFGLGAWAVAAISFAVSGHAATAAPRWLTLPSVALHALALIFWLGALIPLLGALRRPQAETMLRRFSMLAIPLVALLVLSGAALVWAQSGSVAALTASSYGKLLAAKLALVVVLLCFAARNRRVLTPALVAGGPDAAPRLARAIRAEIVVGCVILALASGFRLTPPPRALTGPTQPVHVHIHADEVMADLHLSSGRAGPVEITIGLQTGNFAELAAKEVEVNLAMPEAGIEPIRRDARQGDDGRWHLGSVVLPVPGDWDVTLRILVSDFDSMTLGGTIELHP